MQIFRMRSCKHPLLTSTGPLSPIFCCSLGADADTDNHMGDGASSCPCLIFTTCCPSCSRHAPMGLVPVSWPWTSPCWGQQRPGISTSPTAGTPVGTGQLHGPLASQSLQCLPGADMATWLLAVLSKGEVRDSWDSSQTFLQELDRAHALR